MRRSKVFLHFCVMFVLGVALRSFVDIPVALGFGVALVGIVVSVVEWDNKKIRWLSLGAVFLFLGILRMDASVVKEVTSEYVHYYNGQEVHIAGRVVDIDKRLDKTKIVLDDMMLCGSGDFSRNFAIAEFREKNDLLCGGDSGAIGGRELRGKLLMNVSRFTRYQYGDEVSFQCMIETPGVFDGFDYGAYLSKSGIYSVCYRPKQINVNSFEKMDSEIGGLESSVVVLHRNLQNIRDRVKETFDRTVPYPSSSLLSAVVLGLRREIPPDVLEWFQRTGTSHIIAISGLHITIITTLLWLWMLGMGLPRKWAFWMATFGLLFFLLIIGFRASAMRSGLVGWLLVLAQFLGRERKSLNVLVFAAAMILLVNPKLLRLDLGFQLSFLAVLGIMYFEYGVGNFLKRLRIPEIGKVQLRSTLTMTLSAQVMVLPWIVFNFEVLSLVSVFANVLILPFLSVLMLGGLLLGVFGMIIPFVAGFLGWALDVLISYILFVVEILSGPSWAALYVSQIELWMVFGVYGLMGVLFWYGRNRKVRKRKKGAKRSSDANTDLEVATIDLRDYD